MINRIIITIVCIFATLSANADIIMHCNKNPEPYFNELNIKVERYKNIYYIRDHTAWGTLFIKWNYNLPDKLTDKEILISLLYSGRITEYKSNDCVQELKDDIGLRKNIVEWSSKLQWGWPGNYPDGKARWNSKYWTGGTPNKGVNLHTALKDMFVNQSKYAVGCYTAAKMVYAFAVLDYWTQKGDIKKVETVTKALLGNDSEPLVDVEPAGMWYFEKDHSATSEYYKEGKALTLIENIAPLNFVPGDLIYMLNTDPITYQHVGYEGSNTIYLGQNRFVDYYNDNGYYYTYREKIDEIYNWRNEVFSMSRDFLKKEPFKFEFYEKFGSPPEKGGFVLSYRAVPRRF